MSVPIIYNIASEIVVGTNNTSNIVPKIVVGPVPNNGCPRTNLIK